MEKAKELVAFMSMGAKEALATVLLLVLKGLDGGSQAVLLCNKGCNVILGIMISLELSCNSPVLLHP